MGLCPQENTFILFKETALLCFALPCFTEAGGRLGAVVWGAEAPRECASGRYRAVAVYRKSSRSAVAGACMHACMHACIHACVQAYMHACMQACMQACMHAGMHAGMYACMREDP